jgi:hypothetical protein
VTRRDFGKARLEHTAGRRPRQYVGGSRHTALTLSTPRLRIRSLAKFWRDRFGRAIVVRLTEFNGYALIDLRTFYTADDGTLQPARGLACSVRLLPQLARAIEKATAKAVELGLLHDESKS